MSEPDPLTFAATRLAASDPRAAIARAAAATGVDFRYLLAQAKLESSLHPDARAGRSSAAGLYQFTDSTWLRTLGRHGAEHGLDWAGSVIGQGGRIADPALRAQVMGLRYDADAASLMAAELARDNRAQLAGQLGREPDASELYLAHFLGAGGAMQLLAAAAADPAASAAALLPRAAASNPSIFFGPGGVPRSVGEVRDLLRARVDAAMNDADGGAGGDGMADLADVADPGVLVPARIEPVQPGVLPASAGPLAHAFEAINRAADGAAATARGRSMADTLDAAFGLAGEGGAEAPAAPANVRAAYGTLKSWGL